MSETVNETGTRDTSGATGDDTAPEPYSQQYASNKDTSGPMGQHGTYDPQPRAVTGTKDTTGANGGKDTHRKDDPTQYVHGTLSTLEPGSPTRNADPAYRAASNPTPITTTFDTTHTDQPISDGSEPNVTVSYMAGTTDTVNPHYATQTTTQALPATPGAAPAVQAMPRGAQVTIVHVADPAGAAIRGYRVEGTTGGVDFVPRDQTVVVLGTLVPSQSYKFRFAAVNDNGVGHFSPWSAAVVPLNPDEPGPGHPTDVPVADRITPIYKPDGTVKPGTGGTTGPVATLTAAATATAGQAKVDWTAPTWGTPTGYKVTASSGQSLTVGNVLTATLTGLAHVAATVTVTPINAKGNGVAKTSGSVTPL